jgi:hypothetical protein
MLVCSALGLHGVPKLDPSKGDCCVFADTGDEPQAVYDYLETLTRWVEPHGIPVHVVKKSNTEAGSLTESILLTIAGGPRSAAIPTFSSNGAGVNTGIGMRQCTSEWKLEVIHKKTRDLCGLKPRERAKGQHVRMMIGISLDEAHRMKPGAHAWIDNVYPLVDSGIRRESCVKICTDAGLPEPQKNDAPEEFAKAVEFDRRIRDQERMNQKSFLHRSCIPLDEAVALDERQLSLFGLPDEPDHFGNECEGMCGV